METYSSEIVGIIYKLLPGFITASIFYLLTSYIKPDPFTQVVHALIYTVITQVFIILLKPILLFIGNFHSFGQYTDKGELVLSIIIAGTLGIIIAWCVNNDFPIWLFRKDRIGKCNGNIEKCVKWLSKLNLTNKTFHPTEWYSFFSYNKGLEVWVILHLDGERRLVGKLEQFPDSPEKGHFVMIETSWLLDKGDRIPTDSVDKMLINSKEVLRVEILKKSIEMSAEEVNKQNMPIYNLYNKQSLKEKSDDDKRAETPNE
jgi:hypothetical protein